MAANVISGIFTSSRLIPIFHGGYVSVNSPPQVNINPSSKFHSIGFSMSTCFATILEQSINLTQKTNHVMG